MAFPPTFDHSWDLTQPPDTQLVNQGALDFRSLKDDIMQRMSLLSGTIANRPTPETVNATWGGAGFGLIYIATDTGITYQWNGAAWIVIAAFGGNPTVRTKTGSGAGAYQTTSAALLDVDAVNLAYTVVIPLGWVLIVQASGTIGVGSATDKAFVALFDTFTGTYPQSVSAGAGATIDGVPFSLSAVIVGDGNSHTIKLRFANNSGVNIVAIKNGTGTYYPVMVFTLIQSN